MNVCFNMDNVKPCLCFNKRENVFARCRKAPKITSEEVMVIGAGYLGEQEPPSRGARYRVAVEQKREVEEKEPYPYATQIHTTVHF